jgi:phage/plasmid primase-like uncharacterized protein
MFNPKEQLNFVAEFLGLGKSELSPEELERRRVVAEKQIARAKELREKEERQALESTRHRALYYKKVGTYPVYHQYIHRKGLFSPHKLLAYKEFLIVLAEDIDGKVVGAQKIAADGSKIFLPAPWKKGAMHWLNGRPTIASVERIAVTEGWATAASINEPVAVVAWDADNISRVVAQLLIKYISARIVIYADNDPAGKAGAEKALVLAPDRVSIKYPATEDDFNDQMIVDEDKAIARIEREAMAAY